MADNSSLRDPMIEEASTRGKPTIAATIVMVTMFFTSTKLRILDLLLRERKFNQDSFLAFIAAELANEHATPKRSLDGKQMDMHMDNSMCHDVGKIHE
jgi:hypothetical protein